MLVTVCTSTEHGITFEIFPYLGPRFIISETKKEALQTLVTGCTVSSKL